VELTDGCKLYYEKLILMAATRFGFQDKEFKGHPMPINYVVNNHRLDRIIFYHKVREMVESMTSFNIIVYGYNLCAYECLHFLVTHGCNAENITYVQPHVPAVLEELGNPEVDSRLDPIILEMVADLGITVHLSTNYSQLILCQENTYIEQVEFITHPSRKKVLLDCDLFVNYNGNTISTTLENGEVLPEHRSFHPVSRPFSVLSNAGIELSDRKIVVNGRYCTNDRNIYAAGRNVVMAPKPNFQYTFTSPQEMAEKVSIC